LISDYSLSAHRHCTAAHALSHLGPEGYQWRVLIEDKPSATGADRAFSWWDIQDGNAKLPVKESTQADLRKLLYPSKHASSSTDSATKAAKGAFKLMGKAMASAIGDAISDDVATESHGPPVSALVVKLLDLVKLHDDYALKHGGHHPAPVPRPRRAPAPAPSRAPQQPQARTQPRPPAPPQQAARPPPAARTSLPAQTTANLMDFGDVPAPAPASGGFNPRMLRHANSSPSVMDSNETRAEKLKREQEARMKTKNRVWDEVDERWVEVDPAQANSAAGVGGIPNGGLSSSFSSNSNDPPKSATKVVGISLDVSNAVGKSATVQKAVFDRVNEMEAARQKAVDEVKQREADKKQREEEEDKIRVQLEPKIKAWSEEHGKKKALTALLGSLHTILWPGANWQQISIGDVLDPKKCKKFYFKATLVVHPDKTHDLPAEQRFLAKRIFDALTQAKTIYDQNGGR
jgi:hypothetical protein